MCERKQREYLDRIDAIVIFTHQIDCSFLIRFLVRTIGRLAKTCPNEGHVHVAVSFRLIDLIAIHLGKFQGFQFVNVDVKCSIVQTQTSQQQCSFLEQSSGRKLPSICFAS